MGTRTLGQFLTALALGHIVLMKGTTNIDLARILRATPETALTAPPQKRSRIIDKAKEKGTNELTKSGVAGSPYRVDFKTGFKLLKDPDLFKFQSKVERADAKMKERAAKLLYDSVTTLGFKGSFTSFLKILNLVEKPAYVWPGFGSGIDVDKQIGKLPKPKAGWKLPGHEYTGPYNDLENQVRYNQGTGEITEIYDPPTGRTDAIAMRHDVDYSVCGDNLSAKMKQIEKW